MSAPVTHPDRLPVALARRDAEHQVLGACLYDVGAVPIAREHLTPADFAWPGHGEIFAAVCALVDAGTPVDPATMSDVLDRRGVLAAIGGVAFLDTLVELVPNGAYVETHALLVADAARRRRLLTVAESLADAAEDPASDLRAETARIAGELLPVVTDGPADGFRPLDERLWPVLAQIEARAKASREGRELGVTTGYPELDEIFHGWRAGELIILGAGPKHGKSTLAFNILRHVIETQHAGIVSAEMTRDEITEGLLAMESGIPRPRLASGKLWEDEWPRLAHAAGALREPLTRLHVDDIAFPALDQVVTRCVRLKAEHPEIAFLVVDYLQLVTNPLKGRRGDEEISAVCVALKGLAKRLGVPVLAPAQVNYKDTDRRDNKRPTLADLQGSSGMAQTANFVLLLYRPAMHGMQTDDVLEVELAASRRTERAARILGWDGSRMRVISRSRPAQARAA